MLARRPSLTNEYEWCYSRDPALEQPAPDANEEQLAAYRARYDVAYKTGAWTTLTIAGATLTYFKLRPVPGKLMRWARDQVNSGKIGEAEFRALLVQLALRSIRNFDDEVELVTVQKLGEVASEAIVNALDAVDPRIITELSDEIVRRASTLDPLS